LVASVFLGRLHAARGLALTRGERAAPDSCATLVERICRGDADAETELVDRYARGIRMIISRASRDRSCVEDLCQETFRLALVKIRRGDVRDPDRLSGFMCSLARNITVDHFRRVAPIGSAGQESLADARDQSPSQLDRLLTHERVSVVRRVLSELGSDRDREILFRFYVAEESKADICADLGLTSLHFNRVLFRARERYRVLYEKISKSSAGGG
jgi:RNA polymerase sigma-70 factor (ECF subfamily)